MKLIFLFAFYLIISFCNAQSIAKNNNTFPFKIIKNNHAFEPSKSAIANLNFTFFLPQAATTSAGLYRGDNLITTLWSLQYYSAGNHDTSISGIDENGILIPDGNYTVKVLSNNVTYAQLPSWMNSSDSFHGNTVWRGELLSCMVFVGSKGYVGTSYAESNFPRYRFDTGHNQQKEIISGKQTYTYASFNCTDGHYVYWCEQASGQEGTGRAMNYVYATDPTTETEVLFLGGQPFNRGSGGNGHNNVIDTCGDLTNNTPRQMTGMAVQKAGKFLFDIRGIGINVINKNTGVLIRTINITDGGQAAIDGTDNHMWMIQGKVVKKYFIQDDGTITYTGTAITNLKSPMALAISPNNTVSIIDLNTQQVHSYNNSNGSPTWTLGKLNGYYGNVLVSIDRFMFASDFTYFPQFIQYEPNGSFWVADNGNNRYIHFSANRAFINTISYLDRNYSVFNDPADPTAVYAKAFLCRIDLTQPYNKSWKLEKNYLARMKPTLGGNMLNDVATWPNGRVYSTISRSGSAEIVELTDTGIRYTGILTGDNGLWGSGLQQMDINGDLLMFTAAYANGGAVDHFYWAKKVRTGFDTNGNPTYESNFTLISTASPNGDAPIFGSLTNLQAKLLDGTMISYNDHGSRDGYHLGAMKPNSTTWAWTWQVANSTHHGYLGEFPKDYFDVSNGVSDYAGGTCFVKDDIIYTNYHGENWKQKQTNILNSYSKEGLEIGQFGVTEPNAANEDAPTWLTGNTKKIVVLTQGADQFIIENDESKCGGLMVTKAANIASIHLDSFNVTIQGPPPIAINNYIDLLSGGLPFNDVLVNGTAGWARPEPEYTGPNSFWHVSTNTQTYYKSHIPDLFMQINLNVTDSVRTVSKSLGNGSSSNWSLGGQIMYRAFNGLLGCTGGAYLRILDNNGKIIAQLQDTSLPNVQNSSVGNIKGNNNVLVSTDGVATNTYQPFSITSNGINITFNYGGYRVNSGVQDPSASITNPTTIQFIFYGGSYQNGGQYAFNTPGFSIDVKDLRFTK